MGSAIDDLLKLLSVFLDDILRFSDAILRGMVHGAKHIHNIGSLTIEFMKYMLRNATNRETLVAFLFSFIVAALIIGLVVAIHLVVSLVVRKQRASVFISFQHDYETVAENLANDLSKLGVHPVKLPFLNSPNHNDLLDQVRKAIKNCDVFVCIPGKHASFVENEVSMAFVLEKPILLILADVDNAEIPDTAKRGYPIFVLDRMKLEDFCTLANFCSYLASDYQSIIMIYGAVFEHIYKCLKLILIIYAAFIMAVQLLVGPKGITNILNDNFSLEILFNDPTLLSFIIVNLIMFLVPYGLFSISRAIIQSKLRKMISSKTFSEEFLPETLSYSLTRKNLKRSLFCEQVIAHYESSKVTEGSSSVKLPSKEDESGEGKIEVGHYLLSFKGGLIFLVILIGLVIIVGNFSDVKEKNNTEDVSRVKLHTQQEIADIEDRQKKLQQEIVDTKKKLKQQQEMEAPSSRSYEQAEVISNTKKKLLEQQFKFEIQKEIADIEATNNPDWKKQKLIDELVMQKRSKVPEELDEIEKEEIKYLQTNKTPRQIY